MIDLLQTFGKYLKEKTGLPVVLHPSTASYNEPYLEIVPTGLNYGRVYDKEFYGTNELIGIDLRVGLIATGNELVFLKFVLNSSLMVNKLFNTNYKTSKKFPYCPPVARGNPQKEYYFVYTYEKAQAGQFKSLPDGETGVEYSEIWDVQVIVPIEAVGVATDEHIEIIEITTSLRG